MSKQSLTDADVPRANGMPMLGLGTWQNDDPDDCAKAVETALNMGYRHIDTAQIYGNEEAVGRGIENADVDREDVFLATKVWIDYLSYDDVKTTTEESLKKLGVSSVDLLYIHWPAREYDPEETFRAFNELYEEGKIDRIGVSNFRPEDLDTAVEYSEAPVFANQVECHPLLQQEDLREACEKHGVEVVAYSPLARGQVFEVPELNEIADKHDVSEAQVSLAWLREKGVTAIPKATSEDHISDNWESLRVELDDEDVDRIDGIERTDRRVDPDFAPWN
ncbi:aldo/keto reductase [Halogeometricum limi]|uniref:2,5-diketo-D-gluconate reductase B n=1 Tax=Halogeometricum limi TaxID=555875 RepID=A0A1I6GY15_9EURY|nr:2,5-diketo-D-gluconate reductase B [Halogeometricum limi]